MYIITMNKIEIHARESKILHEMSLSNVICVYSSTFRKLLTAAAMSLSLRFSFSLTTSSNIAAGFRPRFVLVYFFGTIALSFCKWVLRERVFFSSFNFIATKSSSVIFRPNLFSNREPRERSDGFGVDNWRSRSDKRLLMTWRTATIGGDEAGLLRAKRIYIWISNWIQRNKIEIIHESKELFCLLSVTSCSSKVNCCDDDKWTSIDEFLSEELKISPPFIACGEDVNKPFDVLSWDKTIDRLLSEEITVELEEGDVNDVCETFNDCCWVNKEFEYVEKVFEEIESIDEEVFEEVELIDEEVFEEVELIDEEVFEEVGLIDEEVFEEVGLIDKVDTRIFEGMICSSLAVVLKQ